MKGLKIMDNDDIKLYTCIIGVIIIISAVIYAVTYRAEIDTVVTDMYWKRQIDVLQYQTFRESAWAESVPNNAYNRTSSYEWRSSYQTVDHYEEKSYSCTKDNKPDICYRDEPVYRTVNVYDWKYYYDINRWVNIAPLVIDGHDKELIQWPNNPENYPNEATDIVGNIKLGYTHEINEILFFAKSNNKSYIYSCDFTEWNAYYRGARQKLTVNIIGTILKIERAK
jgi:hypothetical protein